MALNPIGAQAVGDTSTTAAVGCIVPASVIEATPDVAPQGSTIHVHVGGAIVTDPSARPCPDAPYTGPVTIKLATSGVAGCDPGAALGQRPPPGCTVVTVGTVDAANGTAEGAVVVPSTTPPGPVDVVAVWPDPNPNVGSHFTATTIKVVPSTNPSTAPPAVNGQPNFTG
jgi:hypothetical protein